ncbi:MAG: leucine-rich repeat domain-containing protein [Ruminococcus sp.]|nr:leucine-rich repeat domain-containing protein [Ruminococcus sp.]
MKNSNSIIAGVMALMLVFGAGIVLVNTRFTVPEENVIATSAETLQYGSLTYEVEDNDTITITGFDDSVTEVEIPAEIDGKPVTSIGYGAFKSKKLTDITLPDGLISISFHAFYDCKYLGSISIPDSVIELGGACFYNCTALQSVKLSNRLTELQGFGSCTSLTEITIPASVRSIGMSAFSSCTSLNTVTMLDGVTSIGNQAFDSCKSLKTIKFPDTLTTIDAYAFRGCISLESVTVPESVVTIGSDSFYNCKGLKEITILNSACDIGTVTAITNEYSSYSGVIYGEEGSTAQAYAEKNNYTFQSISSKARKGDMNSDGEINSVDSSIILGYYAYLSTKPEDEVAMDIDEYQATQQ